MPQLLNKIKKALQIAKTFDRGLFRALMQGVAASAEHAHVLNNLCCKMIVDIGANRGQFALITRHYYPECKIISFEPLPGPARLYQRIFENDKKTKLYISAIGPQSSRSEMHISARDDSSSLLPISSLQGKIFPGTCEVDVIDVQVAPLDYFITDDEIVTPALLKIDVQGYELEALRGCESLLSKFDWVYCECSYVELYTGQSLAGDVILWLAARNFHIMGVYNSTYDRHGKSIQADFLFLRANYSLTKEN